MLSRHLYIKSLNFIVQVGLNVNTLKPNKFQSSFIYLLDFKSYKII